MRKIKSKVIYIKKASAEIKFLNTIYNYFKEYQIDIYLRLIRGAWVA